MVSLSSGELVAKINVIKTEVIFPIRFTRLFMANAIDAYWSGSDTPRYFANSVSESNNTKLYLWRVIDMLHPIIGSH